MLLSNSDSLLGWHETPGPNGQVCRVVGAGSLVSKPQERRYEPLPLLLTDSALPNAVYCGTEGDSVAWSHLMCIGKTRRSALVSGGGMSQVAHSRAQLTIGGGGQSGSV